MVWTTMSCSGGAVWLVIKPSTCLLCYMLLFNLCILSSCTTNTHKWRTAGGPLRCPCECGALPNTHLWMRIILVSIWFEAIRIRIQVKHATLPRVLSSLYIPWCDILLLLFLLSIHKRSVSFELVYRQFRYTLTPSMCVICGWMVRPRLTLPIQATCISNSPTFTKWPFTRWYACVRALVSSNKINHS